MMGTCHSESFGLSRIKMGQSIIQLSGGVQNRMAARTLITYCHYCESFLLLLLNCALLIIRYRAVTTPCYKPTIKKLYL